MDTLAQYRPARLGDILLKNGWISEMHLQEGLDIQRTHGGYLGNILTDRGYVSQQNMSEALVQQRNQVPEISDAQLQEIDSSVANYLSESTARHYEVVPLERTDTTLILAMEHPNDLFTIDIIEQEVHRRIEGVKASIDAIRVTIDKLYGESIKQPVNDDNSESGSNGQAPQESSLEEITMEFEREKADDEQVQDDTSQLQASADETPIIRFVERIFKEATQKKASDVHIEPGEKTTIIRLRIDGVLQRLLTFSSKLHSAVVSRIKIVSGLNIAERRLPQDGRCKLKFSGRDVDVRISTLPTIHGEKIVMRMLDKENTILDLERLGFNPIALLRLQHSLSASYGMILLSGPTGSGKTTTLYAGLSFINDPGINIITVEDPVEYQLQGITQVNVRSNIGLTFAICLRAILRQDPNVVMVGEMRDRETTEIAIRAALTGHLVISTIHANTAPAVISRLKDIGIATFLITAALNLALAQRLIRRLCSFCKQPYRATGDVLAKLDRNASGSIPVSGGVAATLYKPAGCEKCSHTGYKGRVGLYEVMVISEKMRQMILEDCTEAELCETAREEGMQTLLEMAVEKAYEGATSIEEAISSQGGGH